MCRWLNVIASYIRTNGAVRRPCDNLVHEANLINLVITYALIH